MAAKQGACSRGDPGGGEEAGAAGWAEGSIQQAAAQRVAMALMRLVDMHHESCSRAAHTLCLSSCSGRIGSTSNCLQHQRHPAACRPARSAQTHPSAGARRRRVEVGFGGLVLRNLKDHLWAARARGQEHSRAAVECGQASARSCLFLPRSGASPGAVGPGQPGQPSFCPCVPQLACRALRAQLVPPWPLAGSSGAIVWTTRCRALPAANGR